MSDQLSLELPAGLPALPTDLRPMEPQLGAPFDSPNHLFQPLWGGLRVLAFVARSKPHERGLPTDEPLAPGPLARSEPLDGKPDRRIEGMVAEARQAETSPAGIVRLVDAEGHELSALFPELSALLDRVTAASAVLDGELVVVDGSGRHDPSALAARLATDRSSGPALRGSGPALRGSGPALRGSGPALSSPALPSPALLLAFDLLHLDGRALLGAPLHRRRDLLQRVVRPGGVVLVVPAVEGDGRALHAAVADQRLAGVLARVRTSPYLPGVRSRLWRFIPSTPAATPAGGATPAGPEAGVLAAPEAGAPAGPEAGVLAGPEAGVPAAPEAGVPAGPEAGVPAAPEAGAPAGPEAAAPDGAGAGRRPTGPVLAVISRLPLDEP